MKTNHSGACLPVLFLGGVLTLVMVLWVLPAFFEARTYNKLTGANASTWDALWVELRVQAQPKEGR